MSKGGSFEKENVKLQVPFSGLGLMIHDTMIFIVYYTYGTRYYYFCLQELFERLGSYRNLDTTEDDGLKMNLLQSVQL